MSKLLSIQLIEQAAQVIGATVELEPTYQMMGRVVFQHGGYTFFRRSTLGINQFGSGLLVKDKGYTAEYLRKFGYATPPSQTFFSSIINNNVTAKRTIEDGANYAAQLGYPVFLKPNDGSQGKLVGSVSNETEYYALANQILEEHHVLQVQAQVPGNDYRILVLNGKVHIAYQRIPLTILGDGVLTVAQLLTQKVAHLQAIGRKLKIEPQDRRILKRLQQKNYTLESVLTKGKQLQLLDNANLSTGGVGIDWTDDIHPSFKVLCQRITHDFRLTLCGIDIMTTDITQPLETQSYNIIELNAEPGIAHYARMGSLQMERVQQFYIGLLKTIERRQLF